MDDARYVVELETVRSLYDQGIQSNFAQLIEACGGLWAEFTGGNGLSLDDHARLGEAFRRAAIACASMGHRDAAVWRSRSLTLFTLAHSSNGIAMLVLPAALGSYQDGDITGALAQIELMGILVSPDEVIVSPNIVRSAMLENVGILQIELEEWDAARTALIGVIDVESVGGDFRRVQKARALLTTIEYRAGSRDTAIADLEQIVDECRSNGEADAIAETGDVNLEKMRVGEWPLVEYRVM
jgi:hypothetical protein